MPRQPRRDGPGLLHHATFRGVGQCDIFADDVDRHALLRRLDRLIPELGFRCFAWALMSNHAHFVLGAGDVPLRRLMARLCTSYALHFNRRHARAGHLFQNRYWSGEILAERQLEAAIDYVHRNPIAAGIVPDDRALRAYPWCGYATWVGARAPRPFERAHERRTGVASAAPAPRVAAGSVVTPPDADAGREACLDRLVSEACAAWGLERTALCSGGRSRAITEARAWVLMRGVRELGLAPASLGRILGVGRAAASQILARQAPDWQRTRFVS